VIPSEFRRDLLQHETRFPGLSCGVVFVILRLVVFGTTPDSWRTDRRTRDHCQCHGVMRLTRVKSSRPASNLKYRRLLYGQSCWWCTIRTVSKDSSIPGIDRNYMQWRHWSEVSCQQHWSMEALRLTGWAVVPVTSIFPNSVAPSSFCPFPSHSLPQNLASEFVLLDESCDKNSHCSVEWSRRQA